MTIRIESTTTYDLKDMPAKTADALIDIMTHYLLTETASGSQPEYNRIIANEIRDNLYHARYKALPAAVNDGR
jgi:hypothetical protein